MGFLHHLFQFEKFPLTKLVYTSEQLFTPR